MPSPKAAPISRLIAIRRMSPPQKKAPPLKSGTRMATAKRFAGAERRVIAIIVPQGARAGYIAPEDNIARPQYEMLLRRGVRYRILQTDADRIVVEALDGEAG